MSDDNVQALIAELSLNTRRIEGQQVRLLRKFDTTFSGIEKSSSNRLSNVERRAEQMSRNVRRAIAAIALGVAGREVVAYADAWTDLNNKVRAAGEVSGIQGRAMQDLAADARATRSEIEPYVDLYSRILRAGKGIAASEAEVAKATQITAKAFAAGGASAGEQAAGILQLGQALGSGFLQGDELRSIRENAPLVAKAIADAMGVSIGELKALGAEGKLTSEIVFKALLAAEGSINSAFAVTAPRATLAATLAFDNLKLKIGEYLVEGEQVASVSGAAADAINFVADNLDTMADAIIVGTAALAGFFGTQGLLAVAASLNKVAVGATAAAKAMALLRAAQAFLMGPVGIALGIAAIAGGLAYLSLSGEDAADAIGNAEEALRKYGETGKRIQGDTETLATLNDTLREAIENQQPAIEATARADIAALTSRIAKNKELQQVLAITAQAELARAKTEQSKLVSPDMLRPGLDDLATPDERKQYGMFLRDGLGDDEVNRRKAAYEQTVLDSIQKQLEVTGRVSDEEQRVLDFVAKRAELEAQIAALQDQISATMSGSTAPTGDGAGASTDAGGSGSGGGSKATDSERKAAQAALKELELAVMATYDAERQVAEDTYQERLKAIETLGLVGEEAASRKQAADLARQKELKQIDADEKKALEDKGKRQRELNADAQAALTELQRAIMSTYDAERAVAEDTYRERLAAIKTLGLKGQEAADRQLAAEIELQNERSRIAKEESEEKAEQAKAAKDLADKEIDLVQRTLDARDRAADRSIAIALREFEARRKVLETSFADTPEGNARKAEALDALDQEEATFKVKARDATTGFETENPVQARIKQIEEAAQRELDLEAEKKATLLDYEEEYEARRLEIIQASEDQIAEVRKAALAAQLGAAADVFSGMSGLAKTFAGEQSGIYKAMFATEQALRAGQALLAAPAAAAKAMAEVPYPLNFAAAAMVYASAMAQVAKIGSVSPGFKDGVVGLMGPGTGRSDSINIRASKGESIITEPGTRKNRNVLKMINAGADVEAMLSRVSAPVSASPAFLTSGGRQINIAGSRFVFNGPVDRESLPSFRAMLDQRERALVSTIEDVMARDRVQTTPRHKRDKFMRGKS